MFDSPSDLIANNNKEAQSIFHSDFIEQTDAAINYAIARAAAAMLLNQGICSCLFSEAMDDEIEFRIEMDKEMEKE